ncbi:MAG TPA: CoA pyrophosphatase [Rhizomicrobium sp.]|jgi:8-oxo-dGTP pyrophosphatase MutT (NUDIX family)|nr:CoA pyrophosphatase [Rhizomicrobium sp.]
MRDDNASSDVVARIGVGDLAPLRARLLAEAPALPLAPTRGDYDLNPDMRPNPARELAQAAVLLPIVLRAQPAVLFTKRNPNLARHAGQVSFPGGRADPGDVSLVQTALRETFEETGIASSFVTIAGFLDPYETGTGYAILPVVGALAEGFALVPNADEVDDVFEVPLEFLMDPANRERQSMEWQGRKRDFWAFHHGGHYIWGATAAMVVNFTERLRE